MKTIKIGIMALLIMVISSCKKEVVGPQGEQGIQGEQGNANVIGTNEFTLNSSHWTQSGDQWYSGATTTAITQDIVNSGLVQVFIKYGSEWWALPDQAGVNQTSFGYSNGSISILNQNTNGTTPPNPGTKTFRVVIISSGMILSNPDVDWSNYKDVEKAMNL